MGTIAKVAFKYKKWFGMKPNTVAILFILPWQGSHNLSLGLVLWQDEKYTEVLNLTLKALFTPQSHFYNGTRTIILKFEFYHTPLPPLKLEQARSAQRINKKYLIPLLMY